MRVAAGMAAASRGGHLPFLLLFGLLAAVLPATEAAGSLLRCNTLPQGVACCGVVDGAHGLLCRGSCPADRVAHVPTWTALMCSLCSCAHFCGCSAHVSSGLGEGGQDSSCALSGGPDHRRHHQSHLRQPGAALQCLHILPVRSPLPACLKHSLGMAAACWAPPAPLRMPLPCCLRQHAVSGVGAGAAGEARACDVAGWWRWRA